jgi:hypothetical protein
MVAERCMCGATDCPICGPLQGYTVRNKEFDLDYEEMALEEVVETILDYGQWPRPRIGKYQARVEFSLYEFLQEHRDPSFMLEMYEACICDDNDQLEIRRIRERKEIAEMLTAHLRNSDMVAEHAEFLAADDK